MPKQGMSTLAVRMFGKTDRKVLWMVAKDSGKR